MSARKLAAWGLLRVARGLEVGAVVVAWVGAAFQWLGRGFRGF